MQLGIMRLEIGIIVLLYFGIVILESSLLFGLLLLACGISAIVFTFNPKSPAGIPGGVAATLVGSIAVFIFVLALMVVALDSFFDDC